MTPRTCRSEEEGAPVAPQGTSMVCRESQPSLCGSSAQPLCPSCCTSHVNNFAIFTPVGRKMGHTCQILTHVPDFNPSPPQPTTSQCQPPPPTSHAKVKCPPPTCIQSKVQIPQCHPPPHVRSPVQCHGMIGQEPPSVPAVPPAMQCQLVSCIGRGGTPLAVGIGLWQA